MRYLLILLILLTAFSVNAQYYDDEEDYYDEEEYYEPQEVFVYVPQPVTKVYEAITGQRIIDAVDQTILDDQRKDFKKNPSGIYTNTRPTNSTEYMGGYSFYFLKQNIQILKAAQEINPLDFFDLNFMDAETTRLKIQEQNDRVSAWNIKFLNKYKLK